MVAQYGGKYLVIGGPIDSVEATWRPAFPVLFELAHGWYNSEEYRDLKELRLGGNEGSRYFHGWRGDLRSVMTPSGGQLPHSDCRTSFQLRVRDDCIRLTLLSEIVLCGSRRAGSFPSTVSVAQLVERWIVAPVVVGSIPITHPNPFNDF